MTGTVIGPEGGTVTGPDGVLLQIPAGALDLEVEIWVEKVSGAPDGFRPVGDIYEFGPSGTVFAVPVTVSLPYDESLAQGPESAVRVWWALSMDGAWASLEGTPDTARDTVTGLATHFSFGAPGEPLSCNPECTGRTCGPDGCGGQCPPGCGAGEICNETSGTCECDPDCGTRVCGPDPVCGTDCGQCDQGEVCTADGQCVPTGQGPRVCPDPTIVDFGTVQPGDTLDLSFNLKNCGQENLEVYNVSLDPLSSSDFSLQNLPVFPQVLNPDASVDITVRYSPATFGSDNGAVEIYSNDPVSDPQTNLTGTISLLGDSASQACDVYVWPTPATFGTVVSGGADTIDVVLSNVGGAACTFFDAQITQNSADSEFSIVSAPAPDTNLDPGGLLQIKVQYAPVNLGADAGVLTISTSYEEGDLLVDLSGEGVASAVCDLQVSPLTIDFGTVRPSHTSAATITLQNTGTDDCNVSAIELETGALFPGEFVFTNAQTPLVVDRAGQPNSTYLLEVVFAPTQLDLHSAKVWITSDDPDLQQSGGMTCDFPTPPQPGQACVPVTGTCADARIDVMPAQLDFGLVNVGCNSAQTSVTIYNLDAATLNITNIYLGNPADPNFEIYSAPALPIQLAGGSSVEILMLYHPVDAAPHGGMLYIESDATNTALLSVPLTGQGTSNSGQTDVFFQYTNVMTDVLFVVDNSGSMGEEQAALATYFPVFLNRAVA
ncbi:MAG: choice-of-anchor D domain-containing protein, partial [Planctomycetota bacterium]